MTITIPDEIVTTLRDRFQNHMIDEFTVRPYDLLIIVEVVEAHTEERTIVKFEPFNGIWKEVKDEKRKQKRKRLDRPML